MAISLAKRLFPFALAVVLLMAAPTAFASGGSGSGSGGSGGGSGSGGGGGGGGGGVVTICGTMTAQAFTMINYYGSGFNEIAISGSSANCASGGLKEIFVVTATDLTTNPACAVKIPQVTTGLISSAGGATWVTSTYIVPCQNITHTFQVQMTANGVLVATQTVSLFF